MTDVLDDTGRLLDSYRAVRARTEALAEPLSAEDQTVQSMPDASPTKWHRAHTSWFFETFLLERSATAIGYRPYDPAFRYLFNSYYETVGPRHSRTDRGLLSRPGVAEVGRYRAHVDNAMTQLVCTPLDPGAVALLELGLHHEQQHQELLLMDVKHLLSVNPLAPAYRPGGDGTGPAANPPLSWTAHDGGLVELGYGGDGFSFDNERPLHRVALPPFEIADRLVTCGDWLAFIDDGGYLRPELWLSEGWAGAAAPGWGAPLYWRDGCVFTLAGQRPVDPAQPVCHVSYYEADAFARWAGARLPTEAEWELAAPRRVSELDPAGLDPAGLDPAGLHPRPDGDGGWTGQVWQWTSSAYLPYPGFRVAEGAVGEYNGKFMVNQHVLRGSACVTPVGHTRPTYRNYYPPAARWPFTGLRLARNL